MGEAASEWGRFPGEPGDFPPAVDVAAALPAWAAAPITEEQFVEDAASRGWRLEPTETRADLLVIDAGWGVERDFVVTASVVRGRILGIAARMPWGQGVRYKNPVGTVYEAARLLWGRPSEQDSEWLRWDLPDGSFEARCYRPAPVFAWRTSELLAMPEQARPALTLAPGNRPRMTTAALDAIVGLLAEDSLWPQAVERASQLIVDNPKRPWRSLSIIATEVQFIAHEQGCTPDDVTLDQVRERVERHGKPQV